jgi:biopolymer transport protein ExbD
VLRVLVKGDGAISVDDHSISDVDLDRVVKERAPERVLLAAERDVKYPRLKALMIRLGQDGVGKVTFSVVDDRTQSQDAATAPGQSPASTPAAADPSSQAESK